MQLIDHNFVVSKSREYHQLYQANVSQFRFESAPGWACEIRNYSRQFPVSPRCELSQHSGEPMADQPLIRVAHNPKVASSKSCPRFGLRALPRVEQRAWLEALCGLWNCTLGKLVCPRKAPSKGVRERTLALQPRKRAKTTDGVLAGIIE